MIIHGIGCVFTFLNIYFRFIRKESKLKLKAQTELSEAKASLAEDVLAFAS